MFLGLDLGTSGLKGILINDQQEVLAEAGIQAQIPEQGQQILF